MVLYRKYRPQIFAEVTGQNHIKVTLQHQIEMGKLSHAYLFCGPRGVAKTTVARILAKAINCQTRGEKSGEPCNACISCREITQGTSLDVLEIDAASHTGVDHVRENIIENSRFTPTQSRYKIFIIDEVHMLSVSAFNALLKTLEEPPQHVVFVLVTTEAQKLPSTILSRCQRFDFYKIHRDEMQNALTKVAANEQRVVDSAVFDLIVRSSDGCLRDALSLLDQLLSATDGPITLTEAEMFLPISRFERVFQLIEHLIHKDAKSALILLHQELDKGLDIKYFVDELIYCYRNLLLARVSQYWDEMALQITEEQIKEMGVLVDSVKLEELLSSLQILLEQRQLLKSSPIPVLPLEIAIVKICGVEKENSPQPPQSPRNVDRTSLPSLMTPAFQASVMTRQPQSPPPLVNNTLIQQQRVEETPPQVISTAVFEAEHASRPIDASPSVRLEQIIERWKEVVLELNEEYHSLALLVQGGKPVAINGKSLVLGFPFELHCKRVSELKHRMILENALCKVFGVVLSIECASLKKEEQNERDSMKMFVSENQGKASSDPDISRLMKEFDGELIQ